MIRLPLSPEARQALLQLARTSLNAAVRRQSKPVADTGLPAELLAEDHRGAFVTLHQHGRLRGCIGLIESSLPLGWTVIEMAEAAALEDPRFMPVTIHELPEITIEISVLSPLQRVTSAEEIQLGRDGVLVKRGKQSGVFLPQVARETGWGIERFLGQLCSGKAGLPADAWRDPTTELYTFTAEVLCE